jgi:hypothetical protein
VSDGVAVVAPVAGTGTAQAKCRALGLDVTQALAVVALLALGGARHRALIGLVVRLLACSGVSTWTAARRRRVQWAGRTVVAEPMGGGAGLGVVAKLTALVARPTRDRRHGHG